MLANVCLRPRTDEESFRVVDEIESLGIDYDLDLARGLIIFRRFSDWGKYINSSSEIKSRIGDMNILWEGGTVTTSHLLYPSLENPDKIISTKGKCKFNILSGEMELSNGEEIGWWQLKDLFYRKTFSYLEKPKTILFSSLFTTIINFGLIREKFPPNYSSSPFNGFIETFYNLKCLVRMPYEVWSRARVELGYYGLAVERKNLLEGTIDVWLSRIDYEKIRNYPNVKTLVNLSNPKEYMEWRFPEDGHIYIWFKEFPEYLLFNEWVSGYDNFYDRWRRCQVYKIAQHKIDEWNSLRNQDYSSVNSFVHTHTPNHYTNDVIPLLIYDTNRYLNQFIGFVEGEGYKAMRVINKFKELYGAGMGYLQRFP